MKKPLVFRRQYGLLLALLPLCVLASGCGKSKGSVSGKVMYQGKALTSGFVAFAPEKGPAVSGRIDSDGNYRVENVPVGKAKITVTADTGTNADAIRTVNPRDPKAMMEGLRPKNTSNLPPKYQDPDKSGLTCEVETGSQEHNIELQ